MQGCISYEFTGPAFRDYAIAFGLADEQIGDFVREFLSENRKYCASQMLVEFYETFSDKKIKGKDISLMYNSFKAHARMGESISLNISGDEDECKEENIFEAEDADFDSFANIVRRIFSCLRSHSKDTPARKMDFIDNRIIGSSDKKRKVLNFLLDKKVLYTDEQDWLYKLDTDKVAQFAIMWNDVRSGDFASLRKLYDEYIKQ